MSTERLKLERRRTDSNDERRGDLSVRALLDGGVGSSESKAEFGVRLRTPCLWLVGLRFVEEVETVDGSEDFDLLLLFVGRGGRDWWHAPELLHRGREEG